MPYHSAVPLALELGMATLVGSAYPSIMGPMLPTKRWHRHQSPMPLATIQEPDWLPLLSELLHEANHRKLPPAFSVRVGKAGPIWHL
jgi:hypothetical protein